MSSLVVSPSTLSAGKRRFEEGEPEFDRHPGAAFKRSRFAASCSPLACRAPLAPNNNGSHSYAGALDVLRSFFPGMDEKVSNAAVTAAVSQWPCLSRFVIAAASRLSLSRCAARNVLECARTLQALNEALVDCGGNIDAAIRRLGILSLSSDGPEPANEAQASTAQAAQELQGNAGAHILQLYVFLTCGHASSVGAQLELACCATFAGVRAGAQQQDAGTGAPTPSGPQTAEQWVEYLVGQLVGAADMQVAKQKAASVLQQFEAFVQAYTKQQVGVARHVARACSWSAWADSDRTSFPNLSVCRMPYTHAVLVYPCNVTFRRVCGRHAAAPSPSLCVQASSSEAAASARAAKLAEDNQVLKRAVAIQHRQMQERSGAGVEEAAALRAALASAQAQVRSLEMANYSLALHLQKATGSTGSGITPPGSRNPDVF